MDSSSFLRMNGSRNAKKEKKQHIQVFVRVRPINNAESSKKSMTVVDTPTNKEVTVRKKPSDKCSKKFTFDRVFGPKSKQIEVYNEVVSPLLDEILAGYNCTVFAYGQTGSGKTFTMEGVHNDLSLHWRSDTAVGIIPRALSHLFDELALLNVLEYAVSVSFLELYNEELFDLLSSTNDIPKMRLYEDSTKKGTVIVQGLEEVMVKNKHEVYKILQKGSERRQTASTLMNAQSSRSHTIFSVTVHITENTIDGEEYVKTGKLNLVDLAGSENVARSGATDRRAREAGNINQSLLTLGRVITALVERTPHIPYRESKLTRLLQESLGGRTKTSIIATISPASVNFEETLSTLEYAHRAKHITNQPEINQKFSMQTLLRDYVGQIERLKKDLAACREQYGVHLAEDDYNQLKYQLDNQKIEIEEKESHIRALEKTMENKQKIFADLEEKKNEQANELLDMKSMLHNTSQDFKTTKLQLRELEREVEEYQYLIETRAQNENILFFQAQILLNVVDVATKDVLKLHDKIFRKREVEQQNKHAEQIFKSEVGKRIRDIENQICNQSKDLINLCTSVKNETEAHTSSHNANLEKSARDISNQCFCVDQSITDKLLTNVNNVYLLYHELLEEKVKNVSSKLEDQCKMYSVIFSTIAPKVQQLIDTHITEDLNIFKKDLLQNIDNLITYANDTLTSISGYDIQMRDRLLRNIDEIKGDIGLLLQNEHQNREKWKNFQTIMENLILQYNEIKTQEPGNYSEMCNSFTYITKTCDDIFGQTSHIYTNLDRDKSFQEQVRCDLQTVKDDVVDTVEKCRILVTGNTLLGNTLLNKFKTDLSECSDRLETYKTVMEKSTRDMQQKMREDKNALTASINNMRNAIGTISNNNAEAVEANKSMISSVLAEMNSKLEDATANVLNQEKKVSAELQELCERIDRFFIEDMYRDVPTGSTPAKRDFHYPRKVVRSPPEYILKKSREVQSLDTIQDEQVPLTNENTPIIQELNEELN